jgi:hypothetical protein
MKDQLQALVKNFDCMIEEIDLPKSELFEACEVSKVQNASRLNHDEMFKVLQYLNINLEELVQGTVCHETVKQQLLGNHEYISNKWIGNEGTRLKTFMSALSLFPEGLRSYILRKHQIKESALNNDMRFVSAEILKSVFNSLENYSFTCSSDVVGQVNCQSFLRSGVKEDLRRYENPVNAYIYFIEQRATLVEKNMNYQIIKKDSNSLTIEYITKESLQDFFTVKHFGNVNFCKNIQGFFEELLKYKIENIATVQKISCAHQGHPSCRIRVSFDDVMNH